MEAGLTEYKTRLSKAAIIFKLLTALFSPAFFTL
jgi:hypothetical protein